MDAFLFDLSWFSWFVFFAAQFLVIGIFCGNSNAKSLINVENFNHINRRFARKLNL